MDVNTSSKREQRNFGIVMAIAITVVTCIHWAIRGHLAIWPFYLAGVFLILGLVAPIALKPIFIVWMKFALIINWIMTRILLSIVFYFMIVPMRLGIVLFSTDPLKREFLPDADTYWDEPEDQPDDPARYENMF